MEWSTLSTLLDICESENEYDSHVLPGRKFNFLIGCHLLMMFQSFNFTTHYNIDKYESVVQKHKGTIVHHTNVDINYSHIMVKLNFLQWSLVNKELYIM